MNELQPDPKTVVMWLLGLLGMAWSVVMSVLTWNVRRELKRIDALEKKYARCVTWTDFEKVTGQMQRDRERMHQQNRDDLQYIRERLDSISERK